MVSLHDEFLMLLIDLQLSYHGHLPGPAPQDSSRRIVPTDPAHHQEEVRELLLKVLAEAGGWGRENDTHWTGREEEGEGTYNLAA